MSDCWKECRSHPCRSNHKWSTMVLPTQGCITVYLLANARALSHVAVDVLSWQGSFGFLALDYSLLHHKPLKVTATVWSLSGFQCHQLCSCTTVSVSGGKMNEFILVILSALVCGCLTLILIMRCICLFWPADMVRGELWIGRWNSLHWVTSRWRNFLKSSNNEAGDVSSPR